MLDSLSVVSILGPNCVIAKYVKSCTNCCYVRCTTLIIRVGRMSCPETIENHVQVALTDKKLFDCTTFVWKHPFTQTINVAHLTYQQLVQLLTSLAMTLQCGPCIEPITFPTPGLMHYVLCNGHIHTHIHPSA